MRVGPGGRTGSVTASGRIPRSTIDLAVTGELNFVDGMLFPSICDVIRNLSGIWQLMFSEVYTRYFDVPQNYNDDIGGNYYRNELEELKQGLEALAGSSITDDALRASIEIYNHNRDLVNAVYALRAEQPWKAPTPINVTEFGIATDTSDAHI